MIPGGFFNLTFPEDKCDGCGETHVKFGEMILAYPDGRKIALACLDKWIARIARAEAEKVLEAEKAKRFAETGRYEL